MARSSFCRICKDFHDLEQAWPEACVGHFGIVAERKGPQIISDTIAPFRSMADGKMYDSKSAYRGTLRDRGLIEVGNEQVKQRRVEAPPVRETLRHVRQQLMG
jgi:hypothetical protein